MVVYVFNSNKYTQSENMSLKNKSNPILFNLPYTIAFKDQVEILNYAYEYSNSWSGQVQVWDDDRDTYDQTDYFGRIQITRLTKDSIDKVSKDKNINLNWLNWVCRLDPSLEWEWVDTPITNTVKKYVNQIQHLYKKFNRVLILVQKQGSEIPLHTDKVVNNYYRDEFFAPGPAKNINISINNNHQELNKYLTLKFPLTELEGNNGSPIIEIDRICYNYNTSNKLFAINEVDIKHGAKSVNHKRGVIFLDGILDFDALAAEPWVDVEIQPCNF